MSGEQARILEFARRHDWFYGVSKAGGILLRDTYTQQQPDGSVTSHEDIIAWRGSLSQLRNWAGY